MHITLQNYYIVKTLTLNELKIRYKRNMLGFCWSLLNPILHISLISIVFSKIMGMNYSDFVLFLMPGIMAWNLFSNIINISAQSLVNNEKIIKNIAISKFIFPLVSSSAIVIDFLIAMISLLIISSIVFFGKIHLSIFFLPISIIMLASFSFSLGMIISIINVHFRDIGYVINIILQIMFFMTPILYDKSKLGIYADLAKINPMMHFIDLFRAPIYIGEIPYFSTMITASGWILLSAAFALFLYNKQKDLIIFKL